MRPIRSLPNIRAKLYGGANMHGHGDGQCHPAEQALLDRRQRKTRAAIFAAFGELLGEKSYGKITVREIIERADIGRTTFYAHFDTKDELLQALCDELFGHVVASARDCEHTQGRYSRDGAPQSVFCHLLQHLQKNDNRVLDLLAGETGGVFQRAFKDSLIDLVRGLLAGSGLAATADVPEDFLVNHVAGSFVEMVLWWVRGGMRETPEELARYFQQICQVP